jgi:predicted O-methyltransferase YrrM
MNKILFPEQKQYLEKFINEEDPVIQEMEKFAIENNVPILDKLAAGFLEQLIVIRQPKRVLEIGTAIAYSSIRIARNLKKKSKIYTIEKSKDNIEIAKQNIHLTEYKEQIELIEGDALEVMPKFKKKFDFIFLDADKEDYKRLFDFSLLLLRKDGIIFIDNLLWHGYSAIQHVPASYKISTSHIREFNEIFMKQKNIRTTIIPIGDGIGLGIRIN